MSAFTPGPWVARMQKNKDGRDLGWIIEFPNGRIAWASLAYADTNEEAKADDPAREANARLIAASPELYEALVAVMEDCTYETDDGSVNCRFCDNSMDHEGAFSDMHEADCLVHKARAALSKVKG